MRSQECLQLICFISSTNVSALNNFPSPCCSPPTNLLQIHFVRLPVEKNIRKGIFFGTNVLVYIHVWKKMHIDSIYTYICTGSCVHIYIYEYTYTYTYALKHTNARTRPRTHTHTQKHTTHIPVWIHIFMWINMYIHVRIYMCIQIHVQKPCSRVGGEYMYKCWHIIWRINIKYTFIKWKSIYECVYMRVQQEQIYIYSSTYIKREKRKKYVHIYIYINIHVHI